MAKNKKEEPKFTLKEIEQQMFGPKGACAFKDPSGRKNHACSHPQGNSMCGQCRVASEWEEIYG